MFGTVSQPEESERAEEQSLEGEAFNLLPALKKESEVRLGGEVYYVSQLFHEHKDVLATDSVQSEDRTLGNAHMLVNTYFDHIFIENDQEQKIESFRKLVIQHSFNHL